MRRTQKNKKTQLSVRLTDAQNEVLECLCRLKNTTKTAYLANLAARQAQQELLDHAGAKSRWDRCRRAGGAVTIPAPGRASPSTRLPLYFEPNKGQLASGVQFFARGRGYFLHLKSWEIEFWLLDACPTNKLVAAPGAEPFSERQLPPAPRVKVWANFQA